MHFSVSFAINHTCPEWKFHFGFKTLRSIESDEFHSDRIVFEEGG